MYNCHLIYSCGYCGIFIKIHYSSDLLFLPKEPFIWCESIPPKPLIGPSDPGPKGNCKRIMVRIIDGYTSYNLRSTHYKQKPNTPKLEKFFLLLHLCMHCFLVIVINIVFTYFFHDLSQLLCFALTSGEVNLCTEGQNMASESEVLSTDLTKLMEILVITSMSPELGQS